VVNFSHNACRKRHEELVAGTAKPTPESIPDPDDDVKARIQARKDKEEAIKNTARFTAQQENMNKNGWTSRMRDD
jgi:3-methyladenine DNA glycosylase/8-oxoguanine DNA glycosylase